ncbi:MAG: hypothetical protein ACYC99_10215 [Candidatus Geothermincolia bacterium]
MRKVTAIVVLASLAVALIALAGCGNGPTTKSDTQAQAVSDTARKVTVKEVATNPTAYDGQEVTTEGNYAVGYCSACFLLKDGVSALRVEVSDSAPLPPEDKLNARMQVTGKIYIAQGSPNLIADKLVYK